MTDAEFLASIAPAADDRWRQLFGMPLWSTSDGAVDKILDTAVDALAQCLYDLDVAVSFDWMTWYWPGRFPGGEGLASAPVADSVRMLASFLHGERVAAGAIRSGLVDGSITAAINRLWDWYRESRVGGDAAFVDHAEILGRRHLPLVLRAALGTRRRSVLGRTESGAWRPRRGISTRAAKGRLMGPAGGLRRRGRRQPVLAPISRSEDIPSYGRRRGG